MRRKRNFCSGVFLRGGSKLPPCSFFRKLKCCITKYKFWPPKPFWGPENGQNRSPETSRGPPNGQNRAPEGPRRRPRSPEGPSKGYQGVNLTPPRPSKSLSGAILGLPRTVRDPQNPYVSLRKTMIFEVGPNAVRTRPQTRSRTPKRGPTGPKVSQWRQGTLPGGKTF